MVGKLGDHFSDIRLMEVETQLNIGIREIQKNR